MPTRWTYCGSFWKRTEIRVPKTPPSKFFAPSTCEILPPNSKNGGMMVEPLWPLPHCLQRLDTHRNDQHKADQSGLGLYSCNLTAAICQLLSHVLESKHSLLELNLGANSLGDGGAKLLCQGLKLPSSGLQRLILHSCGMTALACENLASMLETSQTLLELNLGDNSLGDKGVRHLCQKLIQRRCKLQKLILTMKSLNHNTKWKLQAVCEKNPGLVLTSYYPLDFPHFPGDEE